MRRLVTVMDLADDQRYALNGGPFGSKLVSSMYVAEGVPVIRGTNLPFDRRFSFDDFVYVSPEKAEELSANTARPGDIVFTQRGTLGQIGIIPKNSVLDRFIISQSQMKLTVGSNIADAEYIYYYFRQPEVIRKIKSLASSSGVPHINLQTLREFLLEIPCLDEQRIVASILSAYDDLIENNTRRIAILEEMARRIFEKWFVHFRAPGCEGLPMVESAIGPMPRGWEIRKLREFASVNPEQIGPGIRSAEINYIDIASVSPGSIDAIARMPFDDAPNRARGTVRHGDTIWSCVRPNRRSFALVLQPTDDTIASTGFAVLRATDVPWSYLYLVVTTQTFADYLTNHTTGSAYTGGQGG